MTHYITDITGFEAWWTYGYWCWASVLVGFLLLIASGDRQSRIGSLGMSMFLVGLIGVCLSSYLATSWH